MKLPLTVFLVFVAAASLHAQGKIVPRDGIVQITTRNFKSIINEHDIVLVMFYADWCVHCITFYHEYAKVAKAVQQKKYTIKFGICDGNEETDLRDKFGILKYPHLKLFNRGDINNYTGVYNAEDIITWLGTFSKFATSKDIVVLTKKNFASFVAKRTVLVNFHADWCGHCVTFSFEYVKLAKYVRERKMTVVLATVNSKERELIKEYKIAHYPNIKLFNHGIATDYKGFNRFPDLVKWLKPMNLNG